MFYGDYDVHRKLAMLFCYGLVRGLVVQRLGFIFSLLDGNFFLVYFPSLSLDDMSSMMMRAGSKKD